MDSTAITPLKGQTEFPFDIETEFANAEIPKVENFKHLEWLCTNDADAEFWQSVAIAAAADLADWIPMEPAAWLSQTTWQAAIGVLAQHRVSLRDLITRRRRSTVFR